MGVGHLGGDGVDCLHQSAAGPQHVGGQKERLRQLGRELCPAQVGEPLDVERGGCGRADHGQHGACGLVGQAQEKPEHNAGGGEEEQVGTGPADTGLEGVHLPAFQGARPPQRRRTHGIGRGAAPQSAPAPPRRKAEQQRHDAQEDQHADQVEHQEPLPSGSATPDQEHRAATRRERAPVCSTRSFAGL